jgi:beta-glucosidase
MRRNSSEAQVGIVLNPAPQHPASASRADRDAAVVSDGRLNRWYLDPLAGRHYPADMVAHFGRDMDFVKAGDLDTIATLIDFLGVNYYSRGIARNTTVPEAENLPQTLFPGSEKSDMGWEVYPNGLYEILARIHFDYQFPALYVMENGMACDDQVAPDGKVHDRQRISYLQRHLAAAARVIEAGVSLRGYFVWSLLDNFEWAHGFAKRFGIIYIDYQTLARIPKDSALWYKSVIAHNSITV